MGRSRSTPGLVESKGKVPVSEMQVNRKEQTSASTATLLTDDELNRAQTEDKTLAKEGDSGSDRSDASNKEIDKDETQTSVRSNNMATNYTQSGLLGCSPIPPNSQSQQILYSPQILGPSLQMINYDRRSPQPALIPFYPHSPVSGSTVPTFCGISPAVSSTHLAIPHGMTLHTPSPTLSSDSHHIQMSVPVDPQQDAALLAEIKRLRERLLTLETENASMTIKLSQQQWEVENRYAITDAWLMHISHHNQSLINSIIVFEDWLNSSFRYVRPTRAAVRAAEDQKL